MNLGALSVADGALAGLTTHTRVLRDPGPREKTRQGYLLARCP